MGSITKAEPVPGSLRRGVLLVLMAALAVCLLLMAWPRLQAAVNFLPVDSAIGKYYRSGVIPSEQLESFQQSTRYSIDLHDHQRYWDALSLLYYLQGLDGTLPLYQQREAFEQAASATGRSLQLAPVQPRTWMRRAHALGWLSFKENGVAESLKMSVYTGRVEFGLLLSRLQLGYSRLGQLDEEAKNLLLDQTLLAWRLRHKDMVLAFKQGQLDFRRVSSLLVLNDPVTLQEMETALAPRAR